MSKLFAIGEILIDFIPKEKGFLLKDVGSFEKTPDGAPANVAAAVAKYGMTSKLISKVGKDAFGDFLIETLQTVRVGTEYVFRTGRANTALAFVSLNHDGERDFSFYRNPSADMLLEVNEIVELTFKEGDYLHFCSVNLVESPAKYAHKKAIEMVKRHNGIVSFDPNVRLPLWKNAEDCRKTILEFLPMADLVKISDEELELITGITDEEEALKSLFKGDIQVVIYTQGSKGATVLTQNSRLFKKGYNVNVVDTTGAGDAFIGGLLYGLLKNDVTKQQLSQYIKEHGPELLALANASGALTTTRKGGISALPTIEQIQNLMEGNKNIIPNG